MGLIEAIRTCFNKYITFSGRASRSEYWWFTLFFWVSLIAIFMIEASFESNMYVTMFWYLILLLPNLTVLVRRLHDTDRSGLWVFLNVIPTVGSIILFVMALLAGTVGPNRFGPDPRGRGVEEVF